ncbi:MAG TPA: hypothetical protein VIY08_03900 [Candidatus Nitrosocosmicus sp.]
MNWSTYNQSLVRRGEILLSFDVIYNWDNELEEKNQCKIGEPFHIQTHFFFSWAMPRRTFICHIDKHKALYKVILKEKYHLSTITLQ